MVIAMINTSTLTAGDSLYTSGSAVRRRLILTSELKKTLYSQWFIQNISALQGDWPHVQKVRKNIWVMAAIFNLLWSK